MLPCVTFLIINEKYPIVRFFQHSTLRVTIFSQHDVHERRNLLFVTSMFLKIRPTFFCCRNKQVLRHNGSSAVAILTMVASHCPRASRGRIQSTLAKDHPNNPRSDDISPFSHAELLLPAVMLRIPLLRAGIEDLDDTSWRVTQAVPNMLEPGQHQVHRAVVWGAVKSSTTLTTTWRPGNRHAFEKLPSGS